MKYLWIVLSAFFVVGECWGSNRDEWVITTTDCDPELSYDVDKYLETLVEKVSKDLSDPMPLPPRSTVMVDLKDGVLWGMSELKRVGNEHVICEGNTTTIKSKLTVDELKGRYTWVHERKNKDPREGYVVFLSNDFEAEVEVFIDKKEGEATHPELRKFVINKFKKAKIEITGMSYLTWAVGEITTLLSGVFQRAIASVVQDPIREALERQLKEVNLN